LTSLGKARIDVNKFLGELNKETERGAALISSAMIDDLICRCIRSFLIESPDTSSLLEGFNAPLGTLAARSVAAFALGLLSEREYRECHDPPGHAAHEAGENRQTENGHDGGPI
jgi:hypothetical protein